MMLPDKGRQVSPFGRRTRLKRPLCSGRYVSEFILAVRISNLLVLIRLAIK